MTVQAGHLSLVASVYLLYEGDLYRTQHKSIKGSNFLVKSDTGLKLGQLSFHLELGEHSITC